MNFPAWGIVGAARKGCSGAAVVYHQSAGMKAKAGTPKSPTACETKWSKRARQKNFYLGASVDEIENIHKQCKKYNQIFFSDSFNIEHYLSLMLLKRKAFIYENEIRIFILHDNNTSTRETEYSGKEKNLQQNSLILFQLIFHK